MPPAHRRDKARIRVRMLGSYTLNDINDWLPCEIIDLGTGGVKLEGKLSFYPGDKIKLKIFIEDKTVHATLEITNISGRKAGGKYTEIEDRDASIIRDYIDRKAFT